MKLILVLAAALLLISASGCTSQTPEVRERAYVQSVIISKENETELTLLPFEDSGEPMSGKGTDVFAAKEDAAIKTGLEIFLGHAELLCLSEPLDASELTELLSEHRLSPACRVLLLHETEINEDVSATSLTDSLRLEAEKGRIPETDLFTMLSELQGGDNTALAPVLTDKGFGMGITNGSELLGVLSEKAVKGLVWLRGDKTPERISIQGEGSAESCEIYSSETILSAEIVKGIPHINVRIRISGSGNTAAGCQLIKAYCQTAIQETISDLRADVIGLDACLAKDCPEYYAQQDFSTAKMTAVFELDVQEK